MISVLAPTQQSNSQQFMRLPLAMFRLQEIREVDLYLRLSPEEEPILFRSSSYPITHDDLEDLERRGHQAIYVPLASFANIQSTLLNDLDELAGNQQLSPVDRFAALQSAVAFEIDVAFRMVRLDRYLAVTQQVIGNLVKLFEEDRIIPRSLFDMVQHDFFTFTHVTNVAAYALLLAEHLGISDSEDRLRIAEGAMLHDIGKRFVPADILCKPTQLTKKEREIVETHPTLGYTELRKTTSLTHGQLMMVYQHHERVDGKGYPVRVLGEDIHPWARLMAVVDVFDALTSGRPYLKALPLEDALDVLQQDSDTHFDSEMVRCWTHALLKTR